VIVTFINMKGMVLWDVMTSIVLYCIVVYCIY